MKVSYNWLKWYVPDVLSPEKLADVFTYHLTEVEGMVPIRADGSIETDPTSNGISDWIFDLNILPNRAHDLLSHSGVARELSGQLGISFNDQTKTYEDIMSKRSISPTSLCVDIQTENCRRYSARIIRNIKVGPSPEWVVKHLESIGQRSINNIVDATNLVMYNCGQPTHAFDLYKLSSYQDENYKVVIKSAQEGEELPVVGRDGIIAKLKDTDVIISDGEKTLGLAGVKGGRDSGIIGYMAPLTNDFSGPRANSPDREKSLDNSTATSDILIEVANFNPIAVRKTARRLGLLSDSAKRFENDLSPELCDFAMLEISALISEMCPDASFEEVVDVYPRIDEYKKENKISFGADVVSKKIGVSISADEIEKILKNYQYIYTRGGDDFDVIVPSLRLDLVSTEDVVEEIGRVYGYDKVVPQLPKLSFSPRNNDVYLKINSARQKLLADGYSEVMTYSFTNKGEIEVLASASDKNFLRTNLSDGLKKSYELNKVNAPLIGVSEIKIFEIGAVFVNGTQEIHLGYANKKEIKEMTLDEFMKNKIASSNVSFSGSSDLLTGESDGRGQTTEKNTFDFASSTFKVWSIYPFITRDIAVWVPSEVESDKVYKVIRENAGDLLIAEPKLIDTFSKDGKTSYAFRLVFQSYERTLTDSEINAIMEKVKVNISEKGWIVR